MSSRECELPSPSSFVHRIVVLSSSEPEPPGSGVSASRWARCAISPAYQALIFVSFSWAASFVFGSWESSCCPSSTPSHFMWGWPTEFVNCSVMTRAKSAASDDTTSSICIRLIFGIRSFCSTMPCSSTGTGWPTVSRWLANSFSKSRTRVVCSSRMRRSSAGSELATFARSSCSSSSTLCMLSRSFICP